jgi:thioredoxin-like negative regulator of GroEL
MTGAESLTGLLHELRAELQVADNPERRVFAKLRPRPSGAVEEPYADDAFQPWEEMLREFPGDLRAVHHLAIMYHARAFDREVSSDPGRADGDWRRAVELWHRLWTEDAFWQGLAAGVDPGMPDPFAAVRRGWPERLLEVHFAIAFDEGTSNYRSRFHLRLALESPFPQEIRDAVRTRAYERVTRAVPPTVWDGATFDPETLQIGLKAIGRYLELDERFLLALKDLIGLLTKLQSGYVQQTNAVGEEADGYQEKLREMQAIVRAHEPSVAHLESRLRELPPETLSHLVLWHSRAGQANRILDDFERAASHYRRAHDAALRDPSDPRAEQMRRKWLECVLLGAREQAAGDAQGEAKAKRILEEISKEELSPFCTMLRANVYLLLGDLDAAQRDAEQTFAALHRDRETGDFQAARDAVELEPDSRKLLDQIRGARRRRAVGSKLEAAGKALESGDAAKALHLLDEAVKMDPECGPAFFLRAQCHMAAGDAAAAGSDLGRAEAEARRREDAQALQAVATLRRKLEQLVKLYAENGGPQAFRLEQQAVEAFNADRLESAARLLREALQVARGNDKKLKKELAVCLDLLAVQKTNETILALGQVGTKRPGASLRLAGRDPAAGLRTAEELLEEAVRLDPGNGKARGDLTQVRTIRGQLA